MTPAYAYIRVSGKDQLEGDGFPRQREAITKYAKAHNLRIVRWFEERAVCGDSEWEQRAAWSEMAANLKEVRTIVIERYDRLARDLYIQEHILRDLKRRNVTLLSSAEGDMANGTDASDPIRVLVRQIIGAVGQYDKAMIVKKLKASRDRMKRDTGRCEGRKPFGFRAGEVQTIAQLREWRAAGETYESIAALADAAGLTTRRGGKWGPTTICKILKRKEMTQ